MEPDEFFNTVNNRSDLSAVLFTGVQVYLMTFITRRAESITVITTHDSSVKQVVKISILDDTYEKIAVTLRMRQFKVRFGYSGQKCSACSILYLPEK